MKEIITKLIDINVAYILMVYDGSGDSGAIDEIQFLDEEKNNLEAPRLNDKGQREMISLTSKEENAVIETYGYLLLDTVEDWCNNDGGYGEILIDVKALTYTIDNHIRRIEEDLYEHEGKIDIAL